MKCCEDEIEEGEDFYFSFIKMQSRKTSPSKRVSMSVTVFHDGLKHLLRTTTNQSLPSRRVVAHVRSSQREGATECGPLQTD
ncbi:hypothetical protein EYF80_001830 [Liparis tanakae]|uniref:Uncharacterized protein n=1 Tax=Liparis tanakae TaxID=230148 RepID=A0A4Z2JCD5_9TELE|nr:hypothetical protein EYF80_001830 [Liparis tanakae]